MGMKLKKWLGCFVLIILCTTLLFAIVSGVQKALEARAIAKRGEVTIVVLGDSIWDLVRDETGIDNRLADRLGAKVYNLAISGTCAALRVYGEDVEKWNGSNLTRMVEQVVGLREADIDETKEAASLIREIDYTEVDYFIIAYGLNDYFQAIPIESSDPLDPYTYGGALRSAVKMLTETYPNAEIVLISPTYCQNYSYGKIVSDSNTKDYGGGFEPVYVAEVEKIAKEYDLIFINAYRKLGVHRYNGLKYLSDATHLTEFGRDKYAKMVADYLIKDYWKHF